MNQIKKNATPAEPIRNPAKAIRAFCLECGGSAKSLTVSSGKFLMKNVRLCANDLFLEWE